MRVWEGLASAGIGWGKNDGNQADEKAHCKRMERTPVGVRSLTQIPMQP
jgi:hypothetical protein